MKQFKRFSLLATFATYLLIFVGGLVRVSGAGLGCPDWPKCFGRWIPPIRIADLPPEFDPNSFNFTLAWIEYINRLIGVLVGFLILIVAILAIRWYRKNSRVLVPAVTSALLVAFQGWQGGRVVASELEPLVVSVHTLIALLIVSLLVFIQRVLQSNEELPSFGAIQLSKHNVMLFRITLLVLLAQIVIGTFVRGTIEAAYAKVPLLSAQQALHQIGHIDNLHIYIGILLAFLTAVVFLQIHRIKAILSKWSYNLAVSLLILLAVQLVVGSILLWFKLPELFQVFHLWLASLLLGAFILLYPKMQQQGRLQ